MEPRYLPYERMPDPAALWTAVPRGLRGFVVRSALLDAKPVNDQQLLTLSATLPANFGYVFAEIAMTIAQNRAGDWKDFYTFNLQSYYQGLVDLSSSWTMTMADGLSGILGQPAVEKNSTLVSQDSLPKQPMWAPRATSGILISIQAENQSATVTTAGTVNAYISFWEFDLEQLRKYPINSPIPVHGR